MCIVRALLVQARSPTTYWSFEHALPFVGKAAMYPPVAIATVAALLPADWELRLRDLHVEPLGDDDLSWRGRRYEANHIWICAPSRRRGSASPKDALAFSGVARHDERGRRLSAGGTVHGGVQQAHRLRRRVHGHLLQARPPDGPHDATVASERSRRGARPGCRLRADPYNYNTGLQGLGGNVRAFRSAAHSTVLVLVS
jgi:hypothetical protein